MLGIREGDAALGPQASAGSLTTADPFWLPLGAPKSNDAGMKNFTPNFPAYPSVHICSGFGGLACTPAAAPQKPGRKR